MPEMRHGSPATKQKKYQVYFHPSKREKPNDMGKKSLKEGKEKGKTLPTSKKSRGN